MFVGLGPTNIKAKEEKLAQSVEQLPFKEWVPGSIPGLLTKLNAMAFGLEGLVPFV